MFFNNPQRQLEPPHPVDLIFSRPENRSNQFNKLVKLNNKRHKSNAMHARNHYCIESFLTKIATMRFLLLLTAVICVSTVTAQTAARSYFKISPNILEGIRDILNRGNQEALQSISTEVLEKIQELVEAEIEKFRYLGQKPRFAVESCKDISELQPCAASGYYWIDTDSVLLGVWCEMNPEDKFNATGGFMKVVELDMRNNASTCPKGLKQVVPAGSTKRLCAPISIYADWDIFRFDTHQVNYTKVCGRITGYQYGAPEAFHAYSIASKLGKPELLCHIIINSFHTANPTLDAKYYVDGVSITHGSPRKHIWTLAAGVDEVRTASDITKACPCSNTEVSYTGTVPPFIKNDFYCETGSRKAAQLKYYLADRLWDGSGCGQDSTCCDHGGWWCKELGYTTNDNIEVRIMINEAKSAENILLETIELYVQ